MKFAHQLACLVGTTILFCGVPGCLSLSLFNREIPDTKVRLDSLERRVSALEAGTTVHLSPSATVPTPQAPPNFPPN